MLIHEMSRQECDELLTQAKFGRIACTRGRQPYVVPIYFEFDGKYLYCFSTVGQKIEWMRANPLVCVEVDEVKDQLHWRSVVILGKYEELCDESYWANTRRYAFDLLQKRAMWWQPAYVATEHRGTGEALTPVFYRISISQVTGHRGTPDSIEQGGRDAAVASTPQARWSLFSRR